MHNPLALDGTIHFDDRINVIEQTHPDFPDEG